MENMWTELARNGGPVWIWENTAWETTNKTSELVASLRSLILYGHIMM